MAAEPRRVNSSAGQAPRAGMTLIGLLAVFVAVRVGVTVPDRLLATQAVFRFGVIAMASGISRS